jgi:hypothetical protein
MTTNLNPQMQEAIIHAVIALSNIPYAPQDPDQQDALMEAIASFADKPDGLAWAVNIAVAKWNRWLGPAELRGLYCSRFRPGDGIEADVMETPGHTAADNEAAYMEVQARDTAARIEQWKREAKLLPDAEREANLEFLEAMQTPRRIQ